MQSLLPEHKPLPKLPKRLASNRMMIRQYQVQDWQKYYELHEAAMQHHLAPWSAKPASTGSEAERKRDAREHIMLALDRWEDGEDYRFFIVDRKEETLLGQIAVTNVHRNVQQSCTIGYWIGHGFEGKGLATEATILVLKFVFEALKLHRASLWISPDNHPSLRIAEKLKLRNEGLGERTLFLGGRWQDTYVFSITSEEWQLRRDELLEPIDADEFLG